LFRLYESIGPSSFSDEVLAKCPHNLAVLQVNGVEWDDLGDPTRLIKFLGRSPRSRAGFKQLASSRRCFSEQS
jgi:hypothetical protein